VAVLGLILLAAAGVLTAAVVTSNTGSLAVDLWGVSVTNVTPGVVFVAGMITTVLAVVGLGLLMGGLRRNRRLRQERRTLRRENEALAQRVDSTPDTDTTGSYSRPADDRRTDSYAEPTAGTTTAPPPSGWSEPTVGGATTAAEADPQRETPARRSFLPPRNDRVGTDSNSQNS
jgi:type II secretory pathway pseudopilin PulG